MEELRAAVELACSPAYVPYIIEGRKRVAAMPRPWVLGCIREAAGQALDLSDFWEYGRLLELLAEIGATDYLRELVTSGLQSQDADVRDMAGLWAEKQGGSAPQPHPPR